MTMDLSAIAKTFTLWPTQLLALVPVAKSTERGLRVRLQRQPTFPVKEFLLLNSFWTIWGQMGMVAVLAKFLFIDSFEDRRSKKIAAFHIDGERVVNESSIIVLARQSRRYSVSPAPPLASMLFRSSTVLFGHFCGGWTPL
jgi:hypothetical protein